MSLQRLTKCSWVLMLILKWLLNWSSSQNASVCQGCDVLGDSWGVVTLAVLECCLPSVVSCPPSAAVCCAQLLSAVDQLLRCYCSRQPIFIHYVYLICVYVPVGNLHVVYTTNPVGQGCISCDLQYHHLPVTLVIVSWWCFGILQANHHLLVLKCTHVIIYIY